MTRNKSKGSTARRLASAPTYVPVPAIVQRWSSDPHQRALRDLAEASEAHQQTTLYLADRVAWARRAGVSWAALGEVLGMTGEGARRRYGRRSLEG